MSLLYRQAASTLRALEQRKKSVKAVVHQEEGNGEKKSKTLAIRCLQFKSVLNEILSECEIDAESLDVDPRMLLIQVYELLFGMGKISGGGEVKRKLAPFMEKLHQVKEKKMVGKTTSKDLLSKELQLAQDLPLYVRVNTCLVSAEEGLEYLRSKFDGVFVEFDDLVEGLVVLYPGPEGFGSDEWVQNGRLVIQDKASCFPPQILSNHYFSETHENNEWSGDIIDACAAPGNKTSQLATFLFHQNEAARNKLKTGKKKNKSASTEFRSARVFAFDKSSERANMLQARMSALHVDDLVTVNNQDFLSVDVEDPSYSHVRNILLDPSCSGSGIVRNAIDRIVERSQHNEQHVAEEHSLSALPTADQTRVLKLQSFQVLALQKAMSFPQVQRIVYSTCSIHVEENEGTVGRLLHESPPELVDCWRLVAPKGFSSWERRGFTHPSVLEKYHLTEEQSQCMIRCLPEDGMNGFFVAMFERVKPSNGVVHLPQLMSQKPAFSNAEGGSSSKKRKASEVVPSNENGTDELPKQKNKAAKVLKEKPKENREPASLEQSQAAPVPQPKPKQEKIVGPDSSGSFFGKSFVGSRSKKRFGRK